MIFMRKIVFMAHMVKITSVTHHMAHGKYASILKTRVMMRNEYIPIDHVCDTQQAFLDEERGVILLRFLVDL